ncbi:hypothetical protein GCM10010254_72620 [Streptomyces chromofuscus]|nr:hypothetical protein GCM10010254_72620 [Streptomyces chromofuscus]
MADGQVRVRRPGPTAAPSAVENVPFTATLNVPRPVYTKKRYDFDSAAARPVRGAHLPSLSPDGQSVAFTASMLCG